VLPIDPEMLRHQLDEQLRRTVELAYQKYLTQVRALETVVRAQGEILAWTAGESAALLAPLPLAGLLAPPPAAAALPAALPPAEAPPVVSSPPAEGAVPPAPPATTPGPATAAAAPPKPAPAARRKRPKAEPFEVYNAILDALDQLGEVFDKDDLARVLGFQPKKSNLRDALFELVRDKVLEVEWYSLGNKPTRYRRARPEPPPEPTTGE
jgi:hypothetical protein